MGCFQSHSEPKHSRWRPSNIGTKQDWQDKFKNIRIGRKAAEDTEKVENPTMSVPFYDENLYLLNMKNDIEAKVLNIHKFIVFADVYCLLFLVTWHVV